MYAPHNRLRACVRVRARTFKGRLTTITTKERVANDRLAQIDSAGAIVGTTRRPRVTTTRMHPTLQKNGRSNMCVNSYSWFARLVRRCQRCHHGHLRGRNTLCINGGDIDPRPKDLQARPVENVSPDRETWCPGVVLPRPQRNGQ